MTSPQLQTEADMIKAIREAGRTPVQRNTFYEPIRVLENVSSAMKPSRHQANRMCWKTIWPRREIER